MNLRTFPSEKENLANVPAIAASAIHSLAHCFSASCYYENKNKT